MNTRELIEMSEKSARRLFMRDGAIHRPMYYAETPEGVIVFGTPPLPKDLAMEVVRGVLRERRATAYVACMEAWALTVDRGARSMDEAEAAVPSSISGHPDRVEVVHFIAEDADGEAYAQCRIIRNAVGPATLGPLEYLPMTEGRGRMVGMLPPRGKAQ